MRLVARQCAIAVRPGRPGLDKVFQEQLGHCLPIVGADAAHCVGLVVPVEGRQITAQVVAAPLLKLGEEVVGPVGPVDFVGVVKEAADVLVRR